MGELGGHDLGRVATFVAAVGACRELPELRATMLREVRRLVDADTASYNEVRERPEDIVAITDPDEAIRVAGVAEGFAQFAASQHPLARYQARTGDGRALRVSDFVSRRELHRLDLYHHVFVPLEVEFQVAIGLVLHPCVIGLAANRGSRDFSERERARLDAVRPFLVTAYAGVDARARAAASLAAMEHASPGCAGAPAIALVEGVGHIEAANEHAARALGELRGSPLAEQLGRWVRERRAVGESGARGELVVLRSPRGRLRVRYVSHAHGDLDAILLESLSSTPQAAALARLGLTRRQAEVLLLARARLRTDEIAAELEISAHTLHHHLDAIYERLGVSSRRAAVAAADAALGAER